MESPDKDTREVGSLRFKNNEIANARLITAASIVDDEHVAGFRKFEGLEKNVDTAVVPNGQSATRESTSRSNGDHAWGSNAEDDIEADASIGNEWSGEVCEGIEHWMLLWNEERRRVKEILADRRWRC